MHTITCNPTDRCRVGVVIPTWRRCKQLRDTLRRLLDCQPQPEEILVHVDAGDSETVPTLAPEFGSAVQWLSSTVGQGPGGGRNLLIRKATCDVLVCLDDDSWPIDSDFFLRVRTIMTHRSDAAILACSVFLPSDRITDPSKSLTEASRFENCGCVVRREAFISTPGYLPLRQAYGMEESDLALQLLDRGWKILYAPELRVYHDTEMLHHATFAVNAAQITNTGLLAFLRYPLPLLPLGFLQVLNRIKYCVLAGRFTGILAGVLRIPYTCLKFRTARRPVKIQTIRLSRRLR